MVKTVEIVSLSRGLLGESFIRHEYDLGVKRLAEMGLDVKFSKHALMGMDYIAEHPQDRAQDLLDAFNDDEVDMILCAIGGDDTYRLLPYLFENNELKNAVKQKIFLGFSDSTVNHFMLHKVGLNTFYGQSFLSDVCELDSQMLPYTKYYFEQLVKNGKITEIRPSNVWYEERSSFGPEAVGTPRVSHKNKGFELVQGSSVFSGKIFGGCIDSIYDMFCSSRYDDTAGLCRKYNLFPDVEDWKGKIMLLETSEEKMSPETYREALMKIKATGAFDVISGIITGKPVDEVYQEEYKQVLKEVVDNPSLSVVSNINIGHATPRCIIPFGVDAVVDVENQIISFK